MKRTLMITLAAAIAAVAVVAGPGAAGVGDGKLVYSGIDETDGMADIFVANADGSGAANISHDLGVRKDLAPHWSPDGGWVVFARLAGDGTSSIVRATVDGSRLVTVLRFKAGVEVGDPNWSPKGKRIVFASNADGNFEIYTASTDGGAATQLTRTSAPVQNVQPDWHPDGRSIVFSRSTLTTVPATATTTSTAGLFRVAASGVTTGAARLTKPRNGADDVAPAWSPDGTQIVFQSNRAGSDDVWILNLADSTLERVTTSKAADTQPAWAPDGSALVYVSLASGATELWAIDLRSAAMEIEPKQLTFDKLDKSHPDWLDSGPAGEPQPTPDPIVVSDPDQKPDPLPTSQNTEGQRIPTAA